MRTLREIEGAEVVAVASPTPGRADAFAAEWDIGVACPSVAALADTDIDVAYIGSANHRHPGDAAALLDAGIPTLCEKPLATTAYEASEMIQLARSKGVFLMEAMWMRFLPFWDRLVGLLDDGAIGPLRMIRADFGIRAETDPTRRWFNPAQGGGALLDVGIYPVSFAMGLAGGEPALTAVPSVDASYPVATTLLPETGGQMVNLWLMVALGVGLAFIIGGLMLRARKDKIAA